MSQWTDRFNDHQIHRNVGQIETILDEVQEIAEKDAGTLDAHARLRQAIDLLKRRLSALDPVLAPQQPLDSLASATQKLAAELTNYKSTNHAAHLANANVHADTILLTLSQLPFAATAEGVEGIREAITSFRKSVGQHIRHLEEQAQEFTAELRRERDDLSQGVGKVSTRAQEVASDIETQKGRLDVAIAQFQKQFSEVEERRRKEYGDSEAKRNEDFQNQAQVSEARLNEMLEVERVRFDDFEKETNKAVASFIEKLEGHLGRAQQLVHVIGNTGMVGGYQQVANTERASARLWKVVAVVGMIGLIAFAIFAFKHTLSGQFSWTAFAARAFVAGTFGVLAAFAAREADKHDEIEHYNRRMELELASIDPYIVSLPEETQDRVKEQLAERLFGQRSQPKKIKKGETTGTQLDMARMALEAVLAVLKGKSS